MEYSPIPPPFVNTQRRTGKRAEGIRYEKKVHLLNEERFGERYVASPWFRFQELGGERVRWCQPDAILFNLEEGTITIVECKLQHTSDAWWQLKWLYLPVLSKAFPGTLWEFRLIEVVKWFDPATAFPEKVKMRADIEGVRKGDFAVNICKP